MRTPREVAFLILAAVVALACAPATTGATTASTSTAAPTSTIVPTASAAASSSGAELDKLRARGTLIVAIRVEAPPANRTMGDPAHAQKRAFETAVAMLIATSVLGPNAKVEFRSTGGDRLLALDQGADLAMTVDTPTARDRAFISPPYAASAVVLAAKDGGPVRRVEDIAGKAVAVGQDELGARDIALMFLQQRGVSATLDNYMGVNGAVTALEADKATSVIGDRVGIDVLAAERHLVIVAEIVPRPYIIATRKNAPDLASAVTDALRAALASGAVRDAAAKAAFPYQAP
jgi:ABC-type amino acid transport substrate-binding protein